MDVFSLLVTVCLMGQCEQSIGEHEATYKDCQEALLLESSNNKESSLLFYRMAESKQTLDLSTLTTELECVQVDFE